VIDPQSPEAGHAVSQPHPGQWRHGLALWREYLAQEAMPQLDRWLRQRLARSKQFGKRDRLVYADLLFNAVRFGYWAEFVLQHPQPASEQQLHEFARHNAGTGALRQTFSARCRQDAPGIDFLTLCHWRAGSNEPLPANLLALAPVIEALRQRAGATPGSDWSLLWHGIPLAHGPALAQRRELQQWSPQQFARFLQAQDTRPPLWLRVNHATERTEVMQELQAQYRVSEVQDAIAIDGDKGVFGLSCYRNGAIAIQDLASQQLAARVACAPGERVWDACAGGGGKTLAIASRLANKGSLWASDIRTHKLDEIKRRAALSRFYNIRTAGWNGEAPLAAPKEIARHGGFDWVLVDAPCSSSGTWRRNPDARLRSLDDDIVALNALQLRLLTQAAVNVRNGGRLVYGTCSFRRDENEDVIAQFLQRHDDWQLQEQTLLGCPAQDSDTMFVAVLQRPA
jgi:16S rRNA (cytosine967-C5)-methyltransferase